MSYNNFDLSGDVFGPVSLPGTFDDYFNSDGSPKSTFHQACFTAGDGVVDCNNFDTLLCVSQQVDGPPRQGAWPHVSIAHRMMLRWIQPAWVQPLNFQSMAAPVDQAVTLQLVELGAPSAGRKVGIEIRLADGWNYYLEYRAGQGVQLGDRALPTDSRVLGTDVVSAPYAAPIARPAILL